MSTHICRPRNRRGRRNGFFVPAFENILNEVMNTPFRDYNVDGKPSFMRPQANIQKTEDGYILQLALPGFTKEDVEIKIDKDTLIISSTKEVDEKTNFRLREFNYGSFRRTFRLNDKIDKSSIGAKFDQGVLTITLATIRPEPAKTIEIS